MSSGADGIRTHDPLVANQVLSQLSYRPEHPAVYNLNVTGRPPKPRSMHQYLSKPHADAAVWCTGT